MKNEEIKELSTQDLKDRLEQAQKDYLQQKINHTISPIDNPAKITQDRKNIARMKTELRQRGRYSKADGNSSVEQNQKMEISRNNRKS